MTRSDADHKPVLIGAGPAHNRCTCTCGTVILDRVRTTEGMAPVLAALQEHRQAVARKQAAS